MFWLVRGVPWFQTFENLCCKRSHNAITLVVEPAGSVSPNILPNLTVCGKMKRALDSGMRLQTESLVSHIYLYTEQYLNSVHGEVA